MPEHLRQCGVITVAWQAAEPLKENYRNIDETSLQVEKLKGVVARRAH